MKIDVTTDFNPLTGTILVSTTIEPEGAEDKFDLELYNKKVFEALSKLAEQEDIVIL